MANDIDDKYLRRLLEDAITNILEMMNTLPVSKNSTTTNTSPLNKDDRKMLNILKQRLEHVFEECLPSLSRSCLSYLLEFLHDYNYSYDERKFRKSLDSNIVRSLLCDLECRLASLDAFQAAWDGNQSIVEDFIKKYPMFKDKSSFQGLTLLYSAAKNNRLDLVKYLILKAKCSVNAQNQVHFSNTLLTMKTTPSDHLESSTAGSTALHGACFNGHLDIVKYLIEHEADYFIENVAHRTPIMSAESHPDIQLFFRDFLVFGYSLTSNVLPKKSVSKETEEHQQRIVDCLWECKPYTDSIWKPFSADESSQLQEFLIEKSDQQFKLEVNLKGHTSVFKISIVHFLRSGDASDPTKNLAWIRCRGSSLVNFNCYSQWQIMFIKHPGVKLNSSPSSQMLDITKISDSPCTIQLNSWYTCDAETNSQLDQAMDYRRKYIGINLAFLNHDVFKFNLQTFTFANDQNTISGFIRWIPKMIANNDRYMNKIIKNIDDFEALINLNATPLTPSRLRQASLGSISTTTDEDSSEDDSSSQSSSDETTDTEDDTQISSKHTLGSTYLNSLLQVRKGDLTEEQTDVIVVCSSSKFLHENILKAGGDSVQKSYEIESQQNLTTTITAVAAGGQLAAKKIYFLPWHPSEDTTQFCTSIKIFVSTAMERAASESYKSIAFPAIGCGQYGCSINLIAQTLVEEAYRQIAINPISVSFVIQSDRTDVYNEFQKQINLIKQSTEIKETNVSEVMESNVF